MGNGVGWLMAISLFTASLAQAQPPPQPCPQAAPHCEPALFVRRSVDAVPIPANLRAPVIDGRLDDEVWASAPVATRMVQSRPDPGAEAHMRTEARFAYDDRALYVAVRAYDPSPEMILAPFVRRDDETTSDWVFVEIDSRHDRRTGFDFGLNPRGVQVDGMWMDDIIYDPTWDAVWEGATRIDAEGWTAEFRIPFSQLPYNVTGDTADAVWGLNIYRNSQRRGEVSNWSPRFAGLAGIVSHFNDLHLRVPLHQRRVELTPYVAPRWEQGSGAGSSAGAGSIAGTGTSMKAGADLRVGLGSNFNLTATVFPDFGQVEQDPSQVNLTALELFQTERRPFFIEGLDAFRFDTSLNFVTRGDSFVEETPFYSRRVGHAPSGATPANATVVSMPTTTQLLAAAKLSGHTASGWTAGVFSAISGREDATISRVDANAANAPREQWPVEPLTATTVARVARDFQAGESSIGAFISSTHREINDALRTTFVRDALTFGVEGRHRFDDQAYELRGWWLGSRLSGDAAAITQVTEEPQHYFQRRDAGRIGIAPNATSLTGLAANASIARVSGRLTWSFNARAISPGFDVNAAGFQRNANWLLATGSWQYQRFRPSHTIRAWTIGSDNAGLGWSWIGEPRARVINAFTKLDFLNYWDVKFSLDRELSALSLDWLRGGPGVRLPARSTARMLLHTDQRRPTNLEVDTRAAREAGSNSWSLLLAPLLTVRSTDHISWSVGPTFEEDLVGWQYVDTTIVARDRQRTAALTTRADVAFSAHLVLQFYAQPFATTGRYDRYQRLMTPRASDPRAQFASLGDDAPPTTPDGIERSLNGNLVLRWEYRPGSFFTAVWNHHRDTSILDATPTLGSALGSLFHDPSTNVFLVKTSFRLGR